MKKYLAPSYFVVLGALLFFVASVVPFVGKAQTDIAEEAASFGKGTVEDITGAKDPRDISGTDVADKVVSGVIGDIPSPVMTSMAGQLLKKFKRYTTAKGINGRRNSICHRAANSQAWHAIFDLKAKGHFAPWAQIAWDAVKGIAGGGKSVAELIKEHGEAQVRKWIKDAIAQNPPEPETVTLQHGGDQCTYTSMTTWDPIHKKITMDVKGNCNCTQKKVGLSKTALGEFHVHIEALVKIAKVRVKNRPFSGEQVEARYIVGNPRVFTRANCDNFCKQPLDQVDPPEDDEPLDEPTGPSLWDRFTGYIGGLFSGGDKADPPPEDDESEEETDDDSTGSGEIGGEPEPEDKTDKDDQSDDDDSDSTGSADLGELTTPEPLPLCGGQVAIDGRSDVQTYPDDIVESKGVYHCGGTCGQHQICRGLPGGIVQGNCTYCHNLCADGQFRHKNDCKAAIQEGQKCVSVGRRTDGGGKCYAIEGEPKVPEIANTDHGGTADANCEAAIRLLLDKHLGWFDPTLDVGSSSATFTVEEHRCLPEDDFDNFHRGLIDEGLTDSAVTSQCPSLNHVSSEEIHLGGSGKGATCVSKTEFSF